MTYITGVKNTINPIIFMVIIYDLFMHKYSFYCEIKSHIHSHLI